jgi:hypothetical protein
LLSFGIISPAQVKGNNCNSKDKHRLNIILIGLVFLGENDLIFVKELSLISNMELFLEVVRLNHKRDVSIVPLPVVAVIIEISQGSQQGCILSQHFISSSFEK